MAVKRILTGQAPELRMRCHPVTSFDAKLSRLVDDMRETLTKADGAGLAAPQIGILRRIVLVAEEEDSRDYLELINPQIIKAEGEQEAFEGCLSVPDVWGYVKRPLRVTVQAQDRSGRTFTIERCGFTARCISHEIDHLEGKIFTDLTNELYNGDEVEEAMRRKEREKGA